ncbi:hypothetical protein [Mucilaginibacter gotjawali]|uniref:Uncharacterized protein n=2 Tax=Mucilaginibacter gotjawali TaxID=1550579 RepID=A0A120MY27_9SPHI|nr:hypothetical protein [Mucilaginibacter gotjawali]MBB3058597.1 hypothetical protein [Mucilaginibacter gotjawali]BAU52436.1 hypothetical protein MgSA37_00597 [Mucilaginibacter gotjawali]
MKIQLLIFIALVSFGLSAQAQTEAPVITELHQLLQSAKSNFTNEIGKKVEEDTVTQNVYYEAKKPAVAADAFILHVKAGQNMFILNYDATGDKLTALIPIVGQYIDELNKMVKTGDYTGNDYNNEKGKAVTDIHDKDGNLVLRYTSDKVSQTVYLYGFTNNK